MTYIIRRAGPGRSAIELDALESARPKALRQEAPGVYVWLEDDATTTPAPCAEAATVVDVVPQWAAIADKARRAKDDATVAFAETTIAKTTTHAAHHVNAGKRGKRGARCDVSGVDTPKDVHGTTIRTSDGRLIDPFTVTVADNAFDIRVIANAISMQSRYGGHTKRFYSVAEHCLLIERKVRNHLMATGACGGIGDWKRTPSGQRLIDVMSRWALGHDADEGYLQDIVAPIKLMPEMAFYRAAAKRLMGEIAKWLGLEGDEPEIVKRIDLEFRDTERFWLFEPSDNLVNVDHEIVCGVMTPDEAREAFLHRFYELWPEWPR